MEDQNAGRLVQVPIRKKVLIVDDEYVIAFSLGTYLKMNHFDVTWTSSSNEAQSLLRENRFAAVITDVFMKPVNGIELVRELRKRDVNCKVIIVSATMDRTTAKTELAELNIQAFFDKPFDLQSVYETLKEITSESSVSRLYDTA